MEQRILLNLNQGDWQTGFPSVTAQLWGTAPQPMQFTGSLPPAPQLARYYHQWQQLYEALYGNHYSQRRGFEDFEFDTSVPTNVSRHEFETLCQALRTELNQWLAVPDFVRIEQQLRDHLAVFDEVWVMLTAQDKTVLRFPWRLWQFIEDYPQAELSLSLPSYRRPSRPKQRQSGKVRVLAILGNDEGIDVAADRQTLEQLPTAEVTLLSQPDRATLKELLGQSHWDVLFFAGHSTSNGKGYLRINATESLTIEELRFDLSHAIANGLQLAILNSCDGLGLAWELADLHLPQAIVMREPVPDQVAQVFLKHFLIAFSGGKSLYRSVREAREKLHRHPGCNPNLGLIAHWLPVIVQNPAEPPLSWQALIGTDQARSPLWRQVVFSTLAISAVVLGLRWVGFLQGAELWAYDALLKRRPAEFPDARLVIVTVDENDIQAQTSLERRGSLADETLLQTLTLLNRYQPRVIGLDLYRDFSASTPALAALLAQPNFVGICKSLDPVTDQFGIGAPPELSAEQIGFSDGIEDPDGVVRRQLLNLSPAPTSPCTAQYGFGLLIAIHYLRHEGILPQFTPTGNLQLGERVFPRLASHLGGLQGIDNRGNQLLLNYRSLPAPDQIAAKVPLQQLLAGQVNGDQIRDRIVIIGVTATSGDYWSTPYGNHAYHKTAGVFLQAQMVSQTVSAVLDGRPLMGAFPPWADAVGVTVVALIGGWLASQGRTWRLAIACFLGVVVLVSGAWVGLLMGKWLPLVPALLAGGGSVLYIVLHRQRRPNSTGMSDRFPT